MLFLLATSACGYRFTAGGAPLPEGIREVYAPVFINRTGSNPITRLGETYRSADEPGVEVILTQAFREQLVRAGVAGDKNSAAQVIGEVLSVGGGPTILTPSGGLASYRISMRVRLHLVKNGRELALADVSGTEDYLPGRDFVPPNMTPLEGDPLKSEANRMAAIRRLADSLMREAYDRLATGW
jgi:hypothetical protein